VGIADGEFGDVEIRETPQRCCSAIVCPYPTTVDIAASMRVIDDVLWFMVSCLIAVNVFLWCPMAIFVDSRRGIDLGWT